MSSCTRRKSLIAKPFAARPTCRAATRSRPAATASSATAGSAWSRCRAAANSNSPTRFSAAPSRAITFPAVEKGIVEAAANGFLAGFPVVDFKVHRLRRLLPRRRLVGNGVQAGRAQSVQGGHAAGQARAARAGHERRDPGAGGVRRRPDGRPEQPPRPHPGHGHQGQHADHPRPGARCPRCSAIRTI